MGDLSRVPALTPAERKRQQRARERAEGYVQLTLRVPVDRADEVRKFVAELPKPKPKDIPGQQSLFTGEWAVGD